MVTTTTPNSLRKPASGDLVAPLEGYFQNLADDTQAGLNTKGILTYANTGLFPAPSAVAQRLVVDQTGRWAYYSDGTKYWAAFPLTITPLDGVTTAAAALADRRQMYIDEWVQASAPAHSENRVWMDLP